MSASPPPGAKECRRGLVLVADDDDLVRFVITETLVAAGFEVDEAGSGEQALASRRRKSATCWST